MRKLNEKRRGREEEEKRKRRKRFLEIEGVLGYKEQRVPFAYKRFFPLRYI